MIPDTLDTLQKIHNSHLDDPLQFEKKDPHLSRVDQEPYIYKSPILNQIPLTSPGVYTLGGGRQIGKTTLVKQFMQHVLNQNIAPKQLLFLTGELIDNHHMLLNIIQQQLTHQIDPQKINFIIIDEVSYIKDWDKAVKFLVDSGLTHQTIMLLTGSDLLLIEEARMRFPGRRGTHHQTDFHLYPLNFFEYLQTVHKKSHWYSDIFHSETPALSTLHSLENAFKQYLTHGGVLRAINDVAKYNRITEATFMTYSDWIQGDMLKRGKQSHFLKEIINAIIKRTGSQTSWNALTKDLSIDHPKTVIDYCNLLSRLDAIYQQQALLEDKKVGAPKKERKLYFTDPFIFHSMNAWIHGYNNAYENLVLPKIEDPISISHLIELTVVTHFQRQFPTFYIKNKNEIDVAYIKNNQIYPIEIKWRNQLRAHEISHLKQYQHIEIWSKIKNQSHDKTLQTPPNIFLPLALAQLYSSSS